MDNQGNTLIWRAVVDRNFLIVTHGMESGSPQIDKEPYPSHQEAYKEYNRRIGIKMSKQGYIQGRPTEVPNLPMLATKYDPSKLEKYVYIQPKFDGIRCVASRKQMRTRRNTLIHSCPHIHAALLSLPEGVMLDGELYIDGASFQEHLSIIKRDEPHERFEEVCYRVFDIQVQDKDYTQRLDLVSLHVLSLYSPYVHQVTTISRLKEHIPELVKTMYLDYEGIIIRNPSGLYEMNKRSSNLQKLKRYEDDEFEIVGAETSETGKERGCIILLCKTKTGVVFAVRPKGNHQERRALYNMRNELIGMWTRVTYHGFYPTGKPREPVAEGLFLGPSDKP